MKVGILIAFCFLIIREEDFCHSCEYRGQPYEHGDEWTVNEAFVMNCTHNAEQATWRTMIVGCRTPGGLRLKINEEKLSGRDKWHCVNESGRVRLKKGLNPDGIMCGTYQNGEIWIEGSFEYRCESGGRRQLVACRAHELRIGLNETVKSEKFEFVCQAYANGTVLLLQRHLVQAMPHCVDTDGSVHQYKTYWISNTNFNKTCEANGRVLIVSCVTNDLKHRIPVNGEKIVLGKRYMCRKQTDGSFQFRTEGVSQNMAGNA